MIGGDGIPLRNTAHISTRNTSGISCARSYRTLRDGSFEGRFPRHFVPRRFNAGNPPSRRRALEGRQKNGVTIRYTTLVTAGAKTIRISPDPRAYRQTVKWLFDSMRNEAICWAKLPRYRSAKSRHTKKQLGRDCNSIGAT